MRIPTATWLGGAAILFLAGLLQNSADLIIAGAIVGSAGLGSRMVDARLERAKAAPTLPQADLSVEALLERLNQSERALAAATTQVPELMSAVDPTVRREGESDPSVDPSR